MEKFDIWVALGLEAECTVFMEVEFVDVDTGHPITIFEDGELQAMGARVEAKLGMNPALMWSDESMGLFMRTLAEEIMGSHPTQFTGQVLHLREYLEGGQKITRDLILSPTRKPALVFEMSPPVPH